MADDDNTALVGGMGAIMQITAAETDQQIATARKYPRDLAKFRKNVELAVCGDIDTAISMTYKLEREDGATGEKKDIVGPSVRFAEVVALAFGNMRVGARIADIDQDFVTVQGMAWDLESNFAQSRERKASIRTKKGFRYSQNMIQTTANAQASTAYREAVLKTIPQALWKPLWERSRDFISEASGEKLAVARNKAIQFFVKRKVPLENILRKLGRATVEEITGDDMVMLGAIYTSVQDNETTAEKAFALEPEKPSEEESQQAARQDALLGEMKSKQQGAAPATAKPPMN